MQRLCSISVLLCAASFADAGAWSSPSGMAEHFTYANGRDANGTFGDPIVSGDTFVFPEYHYTATAGDGSTVARSDTVSVDLLANPGWKFGLMRVAAFGDYAVSGDPAENFVDLDALLAFEELASPWRRLEGVMATNPLFPRSDFGGWTGLAVVDFTFESPEAANAMHLEYSNGMIAVSGPAGSAHIHCHGEGGGFELTVGMVEVPEPASFALLAVGAAAAIVSYRHAGPRQRRFR